MATDKETGDDAAVALVGIFTLKEWNGTEGFSPWTTLLLRSGFGKSAVQHREMHG